MGSNYGRLCNTLALILCLWGTVANAKEPAAIFGFGTMKCRAYANMTRDKDAEVIADQAFAWVQGWFSAKNIGNASSPSTVRTVGGSLSPDTLKGFLVNECEDHPDEEGFVAANNLYARFAAKGL